MLQAAFDLLNSDR